MKSKKIQLFLSYNFKDDSFVRLVSYYLGKQETLKPYLWTVDGSAVSDFPPQIKKALSESDVFLLFLGKELGKIQKMEVDAVIPDSATKVNEIIPDSKIGEKILIKLGQVTVDKSMEKVEKWYTVPLDNFEDEKNALACARAIVTGGLHLPWIEEDGVPVGYIFDYEKDIIREYIEGISGIRIEKGCPSHWPVVERNRGNLRNPVDKSRVGLYRDWDYVKKKIKTKDPQVVPAALSDYHICCLKERNITFPEAGPRRQLYYPNDLNGNLRVGILVSGGIAPGINSVIAGIVERQSLYAREGEYLQTLRILGFLNGFNAFQGRINITDLDEQKVANIKNDGGSFIGSSRVDILADYSEPILRAKALKDLAHRISDQVDILYVIGGHGSMRAAHAIWKIAGDESGSKLSVVAIPKTMDNDILWVWQSFGFMSAVERAKELIDCMSTEVKSYPGLCVIQLFGSDSGFVASHAVQASGLCDVCLIPEVPFTMEALSKYIKKILVDKYRTGKNPYSIIVMAETAVPTDVEDYINEFGEEIALTEDERTALLSYHDNKRLSGHTPDPLRRGALKVVSRVLEKKIKEIKGEPWNIFRVITNEPKHLIRAIPPSCSDMIFGQRLGSLAVDCAMAGYTDFMISQWLTEYVMVPLPLVILGRKHIPREGIFWNSVKATTGQPDLN